MVVRLRVSRFPVAHEPTPIVHYYAYLLGEVPDAAALEARIWARIDRAFAIAVDHDEYLGIVTDARNPMAFDALFGLSLDEPTRRIVGVAPVWQISAPNRAVHDPLGLAIGKIAADEAMRLPDVLVHDWFARRRFPGYAEDTSEDDVAANCSLGGMDDTVVETNGLVKYGLPELRGPRRGDMPALLARVAERMVAARRAQATLDRDVVEVEVDDLGVVLSVDETHVHVEPV